MATLAKKEPHRLASIATVRDEDPASAGLHHLLNVLGLLGQAPEEQRSNHSFRNWKTASRFSIVEKHWYLEMDFWQVIVQTMMSLLNIKVNHQRNSSGLFVRRENAQLGLAPAQ